MKRIIKMFLCLLAVFGLTAVLAPQTVYAETSGDFEYEVSDGKATIAKYTGSEINLEIPKELDGHEVVAIGESAFANNITLGSVTFQEGSKLTSIGTSAFHSCSLQNLVIPDRVTSIGMYAFSGCFSLTNITIPVSVTSIGNDAFLGCFKLITRKYNGSKSQWKAITKDEAAFENWPTSYGAWDVTITPGDYMTASSTIDLTQVVTDESDMKAVTFTAAKGYYFPADYAVPALPEGFSVTRSNDGSQVTVSGKPTADTTITLPAAAEKPEAPSELYGIYIAGVRMNNLNAGDLSVIEGVDLAPGGEASFDPSTNTLTLKDASIGGSGAYTDNNYSNIAVTSSIKTLKIVFSGENSVEAESISRNCNAMNCLKTAVIMEGDDDAVIDFIARFTNPPAENGAVRCASFTVNSGTVECIAPEGRHTGNSYWNNPYGITLNAGSGDLLTVNGGKLVCRAYAPVIAAPLQGRVANGTILKGSTSYDGTDLAAYDYSTNGFYGTDGKFNGTYRYVEAYHGKSSSITVTASDISTGMDETINVEVLPTDATGTVTLTVTDPNGKDTSYDIEIKANDQGKGSLTIPKPAAGEYKVKAEYSGDSSYAPSSSKETVFKVTAVYTVTITPGDNMVHDDSSGALSQSVAPGSKMTDVVFTTGGAYEFRESYKVDTVNGISVTRNSDSQITVAGTPTADTTIILPEATVLPIGIFTVSFDANGGGGTMKAEKIGGPYGFPECGFTAPEGKEFDCWVVEGKEYAAGDVITVAADITVTAQWKFKAPEPEPAHIHNPMIVEAVEATCEENGSKTYYKCSCGRWFQDFTAIFEITDKSSVIIPALGHEWDAGVVTRKPDYATEGKRTYTCQRDSSHTKIEYIPRLTKSSSDDSDGGGTTETDESPTFKRFTDENGVEYWMCLDHGSFVKDNWCYVFYNGIRYWYYFGADGKMQTGWLKTNEGTYYLWSISDGWKGRMMTGYQMIDGKGYYFETEAGKNQGRMYRNEQTPDGYWAGEDGSFSVTPEEGSTAGTGSISAVNADRTENKRVTKGIVTVSELIDDRDYYDEGSYNLQKLQKQDHIFVIPQR